MGSERCDQLDNRPLGGGANPAGAVAPVVFAGLGSLFVGGLPAAGLVLVCVNHGGNCGVVLNSRGPLEGQGTHTLT
jgi:hypothetical protein